MNQIVLRPTWKAMRGVLLRSLPTITIGTLAFLLGRQDMGVRLGGLVFIGLAAVLVVNKATTRLVLDGDELRVHALLGGRGIAVAEIERLVPVKLTITYGFISRHRSSGSFYDVMSQHGSSGIYLNPDFYGVTGVDTVIQAIGKNPQLETENRRLDVYMPGLGPRDRRGRHGL